MCNFCLQFYHLDCIGLDKRKLPFTNRGVYQQPPLKNFKILKYGYTTNEFEHACTQ